MKLNQVSPEDLCYEFIHVVVGSFKIAKNVKKYLSRKAI